MRDVAWPKPSVLIGLRQKYGSAPKNVAKWCNYRVLAEDWRLDAERRPGRLVYEARGLSGLRAVADEVVR